jgi:hypothetical protein
MAPAAGSTTLAAMDKKANRRAALVTLRRALRALSVRAGARAVGGVGRAAYSLRCSTPIGGS